MRYSLSSRDLEEMMLERGLYVDHTTISRWVQHDAPELEKRCHRHLKATNDSWRVDGSGSHLIPLANPAKQRHRDVQKQNAESERDERLSPMRDSELC